MTTTTQTVIKIGDSMGVTLPAKELKRLGIKAGDTLRVSFEPDVPKDDDVLKDYARFKKRYGETLRHLADRDAADEEVLEMARIILKRHEKALRNLADR